MTKIRFTTLLIATLVLLGCTKKNNQKQSVAETLPKVRVLSVFSEEVPQTIEFSATVEPEVKNNIAPSTPGRIREIYVEVGSVVYKGQKLAKMDNASLNNLEVQIENLKRSYNRVAGLHTVGGASQQELDNARLQLEMAETNLKNLSENTELISPINGLVTARNYDVGDIYNAQMPILTVMQITPVQLKINVSESYYNKVKKGMPVDVQVDVFENETFTGRVSLVYPVIDERTRTFGVEIKIANKNTKIRPGMFARAQMNFGTLKQVVVPDVAVVKQSGSAQRFVFVYANGKVSYRKVTLGQRLGAKYELLSGVESGEQVVVSDQSKLNDGVAVDVVT